MQVCNPCDTFLMLPTPFLAGLFHELFHQRGFKIPFIVINIRKDVFVQNEVIGYIRSQISPIKLHTTIFDDSAEKVKITEIKYPNIIKDLIK